MGAYILSLMVTLDQELAIQTLFTQKHWRFIRIYKDTSNGDSNISETLTLVGQTEDIYNAVDIEKPNGSFNYSVKLEDLSEKSIDSSLYSVKLEDLSDHQPTVSSVIDDCTDDMTVELDDSSHYSVKLENLSYPQPTVSGVANDYTDGMTAELDDSCHYSDKLENLSEPRPSVSSVTDGVGADFNLSSMNDLRALGITVEVVQSESEEMDSLVNDESETDICQTITTAQVNKSKIRRTKRKNLTHIKRRSVQDNAVKETLKVITDACLPEDGGLTSEIGTSTSDLGKKHSTTIVSRKRSGDHHKHLTFKCHQCPGVKFYSSKDLRFHIVHEHGFTFQDMMYSGEKGRKEYRFPYNERTMPWTIERCTKHDHNYVTAGKKYSHNWIPKNFHKHFERNIESPGIFDRNKNYYNSDDANEQKKVNHNPAGTATFIQR